MRQDKILDTLNEIKALADKCITALSGDTKASRKPVPTTPSQKSSGSDSNLAIVNDIKACDEADKIETHVLDKASVAGRILLPFFICSKYFPERRLTSGDVEKITSDLGVKVKTSNVSTAITNSLLTYLDGDSTRVKGKAVSYKLNRKGIKHFESILAGNDEE
jgi:hypothetical protein